LSKVKISRYKNSITRFEYHITNQLYLLIKLRKESKSMSQVNCCNAYTFMKIGFVQNYESRKSITDYNTKLDAQMGESVMKLLCKTETETNTARNNY